MERQWIDGVLFDRNHRTHPSRVTLDVRARPPGATIRELVVTAEGEPSWP